jgi:hypothetical protein
MDHSEASDDATTPPVPLNDLRDKLTASLVSLSALLSVEISRLSPKMAVKDREGFVEGLITRKWRGEEEEEERGEGGRGGGQVEEEDLFSVPFVEGVALLFESCTSALTSFVEASERHTDTHSAHFDLYSGLISDIFVRHPNTPSSFMVMLGKGGESSLERRDEARKECERMEKVVAAYGLVLKLGDIRGLG